MELVADGLTPAVSRQLEQLVGAVSQRIAELDRALQRAAQSGGDHAWRSSSAVVERLGTMTSDQHALLWSFAALVGCWQGRVGSGEMDPRTSWWRECCEEDLRRAGRCSDELFRAASGLAELLDGGDVAALPAQLPVHDLPRLLVHVYERLLAASNSQLRRRCGAYFTPPALVQYVVRSVDALLERDLGIPNGLNTTRARLRVVDPACGSGAFLLELLPYLACSSRSDGRDVLPPSSTELRGIDLLPAHCGAAQLLVELGWPEHGCRQRPLEASQNGGPAAPWLVRCGNPLADPLGCGELFANGVPVIVGNPPYSNFGRCNRHPWILEQLLDYKQGLHEKKLNLDDDFIKFMRWSQYWVDQAGRGIVALVTSNTYMGGLTHRQMRASLLKSFDQIYLLNLHGSSQKRIPAADPHRDENVFPIKQGVAIGLFVKSGRPASARAAVHHAELRGSREFKLSRLTQEDVTRVRWNVCDAGAPHYFFSPRPAGEAADYLQAPRLDDIFARYVSGVQTKCDALFVGFTADTLAERVAGFLADAAQDRFADDVPSWLRSRAQGFRFDRRRIRPYMVAPFDVRWVYYEPGLLGRARHLLLQHLDGHNMGLVFMRQSTNPGPYDHFLVTNMLVSDRVFYSARGAPFVAPLYERGNTGKTANLKAEFLQELAQRLGLAYRDSENELPARFGPRDVLHWIYATVHDPDYRKRYRELLGIDFPRIPWPTDRSHFQAICRQGEALVAEHLSALGAARDPAPQDGTATDLLIAPGYPRWNSGELWLNRDYRWPEAVEAAVWHTHIGGYWVLPRWLKQRRARQLATGDLRHLRRMMQVLGGLPR